MPNDQNQRLGGMNNAAIQQITSNNTPLVSVIIVNYNGKHFLKACFNSLNTQRFPKEKTEFILVDNDSKDGSLEYMQTNYPWVRIIEAKANLGFAAGNNLGFKHALGKFIVLLNNDTEVTDNWLSELVECALKHEDAGMVCSKVMLHKNREVINSTGLCILGDGRGYDRGFFLKDTGQFEIEQEVFGGSGSSLLLRRELINETEGFDTRLFMYYEDLDLGWRARLAGWKCYYCPTSIMYHIHCGSSGKWSPFFTFHVERNRALVSLKNAPFLMALRVQFIFICKCALKLALNLPLLPFTKNSRSTFATYLKALCSYIFLTPGFLKSRFTQKAKINRTFVYNWFSSN